MYVTLTGARETPPARGRACAMAMKESRRVLTSVERTEASAARLPV